MVAHLHGNIIQQCWAIDVCNSSRRSALLAQCAFIISIILAFSSAHAFGLSPFVPSCCTVVSVGKQTYPMHVPAKPFHFSERNGCVRLQCFRTCVVNSTCVVLCKHICVPPLYLSVAGHDQRLSVAHGDHSCRLLKRPNDIVIVRLLTVS